ncbi:hypothetical protein PG993_006585 [Apiospora rasikravindrae]|uniref:Uncharacterized protein n=1 Tax=Apiospora rasikravindrae TaxID=990691 RepID=A0ABR1T652_9PEZI
MAVFSLFSAGVAERASATEYYQDGDHGNRSNITIKILPGGAGGPGRPKPGPGPRPGLASPVINPAARPGPPDSPLPPPPSPLEVARKTTVSPKATTTVVQETRSLTQVTTTSLGTTTQVTLTTAEPASSTVLIPSPHFSISTSSSSATELGTSTSLSSTSTSSITGGVISSTALGRSASPSESPVSDHMAADNGNAASDRTLVITLSTVLRSPLFNRGITPIHDDEIATWKINRTASEKSDGRYTTRDSTTRNSAAHGHKKAPSQTPSLIQYQQPLGKQSFDSIAQSPRSFIQRQSMDLPQSPQSVILAKAPNARSGLTDQAIPGDDPFLPGPKRQPSRLHKLPSAPPPTSGNMRTRSSRSSSMRSFGDVWHGDNMGIPRSPRPSTEAHNTITRTTSSRIYSSATIPPRFSLSDHNEPVHFNGLSPPPLHSTDIGRAIG